jgi:hypothetical protein
VKNIPDVPEIDPFGIIPREKVKNIPDVPEIDPFGIIPDVPVDIWDTGFGATPSLSFLSTYYT